jgi:hypothetical protein
MIEKIHFSFLEYLFQRLMNEMDITIIYYYDFYCILQKMGRIQNEIFSVVGRVKGKMLGNFHEEGSRVFSFWSECVEQIWAN